MNDNKKDTLPPVPEVPDLSRYRASGRRITIKDLAQRTGLSLGAVSQALNPRKSTIKVRPETIERVQRVAREIGYRPHAGASSIRSRYFHNIGYFMANSGVPDYEPTGFQVGVHDAALEDNFRVTLLRLPSNPSEIKNHVSRVFLESHLDALIIANYSILFPEYKRVLQTTDFPIIYLNDYEDQNSIYVDDVEGGRLATEHLIRRGNRKIYFVKVENGPVVADSYSLFQRTEGYKQAMKSHGLEPVVKHYQYPQDDAQIFKELFEADRPEAIVGYCDLEAVQLLKFAYRKGIKIPEELSVIGYNDDVFARHSWVTLSTIRIPYYEMGRAAFKMAIRAVDALERIEPEGFEPELIVRASTAKEALTPVPFPMDAIQETQA